MPVEEMAKALQVILRQPAASMMATSPPLLGHDLACVAESMRRHRQALQLADGSSFDEMMPPLLLFADSWLGQLPLEACPCLARRQVVRGIAPNIALRAWEEAASRRPTGGYYVVDPSSTSESPRRASTGIASKVLSLFGEWDNHAIDEGSGRWTGHVGRPGPDSGEVLRQLAARSNFLYIGHGECARRLLQSSRLEQGAPTRAQAQVSASEAVEFGQPRVPLQSVVALMGCSSARLVSPSCASSTPSFEPLRRESEEFEAFGLPLSLLIGGSPAVLGAAWDILAGDVDRLTCALLRAWARNREKESLGPSSLLSALREARAAGACMLPNLTGASLVYYGIPV